jgi:integrative and conjugative element protein (TIGR02256 family)
MFRDASLWSPLETGGVLLGYSGGEGDLVVTTVIGGGPSASRRETSFEPDHEYQAREIALAYERSGRRWAYLGDWHTHPNGQAVLSRTDRRTLRRIARTPEARAPQPTMLLLTTTAANLKGEIAAFRLASATRSSLAVTTIPVILFGAPEND